MNKYLEKLAEMSDQSKDNLTHTGILGALGGAEAMGMNKVLSHPKIKNMGSLGKFGLSAGVTLGLDYAGVKLGNSVNKWRKGLSASPVANKEQLP
jgi:hypothetical protein